MKDMKFIQEIPDGEKTLVVVKLLETIQLLTEKIQLLEDEIARLKDHKPKPRPKPSNLDFRFGSVGQRIVARPVLASLERNE